MDLHAWNRVLLDRLKADARPQRRLYLYVDRETLASVAGLDAGAAGEDWSRAVRDAGARQPCEGAYLAARRWKASGWLGDPPIIAALAMTVLAVTEMPLGHDTSVYPRQNELLGLPIDGGMPPDYDLHVPGIWRIWTEWLDGGGA